MSKLKIQGLTNVHEACVEHVGRLSLHGGNCTRDVFVVEDAYGGTVEIKADESSDRLTARDARALAALLVMGAEEVERHEATLKRAAE
jgi:hypothetical protein